MRIALHVPRASHLRPGPSGDRVFVAGLLEGLRGRGHRVVVVSRVNVREIWRGKVPLTRLVGEAIRVVGAVARFAPEGWLVYGPSTTNPDLFGWWLRPKSYVLFAAGVGRGTRLPPRWRRLFWFAHRRSLSRADKVVAYHPAGADELRAAGVPRGRLEVIPLGISPWARVPSRAEARRRLALPEQARVVLCISRFAAPDEEGGAGKTKMLLDLVAAMASLPPDALLVLGGDGPGRHLLEAEAARLGLERRLRLTGQMAHDEVKWLYAAANVYAYPLATDRPWLTVMEAQACGLPVVTMRTRSGEMTVEDGRTGLLASDLMDFRTHLAALVGDPARCEAMGQAARDYIAGSHSMACRLRQIEAMLHCPSGHI